MKCILGFFCVALLLLCSPPAAQATVILFDDLGINGAGAVPKSYQGFLWENWYWLDAVYIEGVWGANGYTNGVVSERNVVYNIGAGPVSVTGDPFDFNGAHFTAAWNDGLNISVTAYSGGALRYAETFQVYTDGPTHFEANYIGIDELRIESSGGIPHGWFSGLPYFAMDNFAFNEESPVPPGEIPEPGSILLLGAGVLGLGVVRRARRRRV